MFLQANAQEGEKDYTDVDEDTDENTDDEREGVDEGGDEGCGEAGGEDNGGSSDLSLSNQFPFFIPRTCYGSH